MTVVTVIDHAHTQETITILQDTHLPLDLLQDQEFLDIPDPDVTLTKETKLLHNSITKRPKQIWSTYVSHYRNG